MRLPFNPRIVADTKHKDSVRLTTFYFPFPTCLLQELVKHRSSIQTEIEYVEFTSNNSYYNKNAESTRAVPLREQIARIREYPFLPIWTFNKSGMQGEIVQDEDKISELNEIALGFMEKSIAFAEKLDQLGIHKQDASVYLRGFGFTTVVMTMDEVGFKNFVEQRASNAANPYFHYIAKQLLALYNESTPSDKTYHIAFDNDIEEAFGLAFSDDSLESIFLKSVISASIVARTSFGRNIGGNTIQQHISRAKRLLDPSYKHFSIAEHQYFYSEESLGNGIIGDGWVSLRAQVVHNNPILDVVYSKFA